MNRVLQWIEWALTESANRLIVKIPGYPMVSSLLTGFLIAVVIFAIMSLIYVIPFWNLLERMKK